MKKLVGTVDCTPKWRGVLPILTQVLRDPDIKPEVRATAEDELRRMADAADRYNDGVLGDAERKLLGEALAFYAESFSQRTDSGVATSRELAALREKLGV